MWIETSTENHPKCSTSVTSLAEVWIETTDCGNNSWRKWSLPLRKCGLKLAQAVEKGKASRSLPLRKCGLKQCFRSTKKQRLASLPLRKCGLKRHWNMETARYICHFPCGSVDWNNALAAKFAAALIVTSLAEVWIETRNMAYATATPSVTSLAEVWIETNILCIFVNFILSLPLRKCGLKPLPSRPNANASASLPLRKCGLKLLQFCLAPKVLRHFPCGSVDWNCLCIVLLIRQFRHFPCGSVDWNFYHRNLCHVDLVTSLAEVWIETFTAVV